MHVLGAATLIASGAAYAQQTPVRPNQLLAFISALDASGAPVTDLKREEIDMTENGAPGKVVSFDRYSLPIKLTIGVDNSKDGTIALAALRQGLSGLVKALPPDMEVTLITTAPQPEMFVKPTSDHAQILRGIERFGPDANNTARFSSAMIEYAERLEKDFKDKKLSYSPMLVMVSTSTPENGKQQVDQEQIEKATKAMARLGARMSLAMMTTKPANPESVDLMQNGRQAAVAGPIIKASRGKLETMVDYNRLTTVLPEWGREIALSHTRQTNQFRVVIDRPGGATGPLNNLGLRLTRSGLNGSVSSDGRFIP
jgi:hypothetical protein